MKKFGKAFILFLLLAMVIWIGICRPCSVPMDGMEPALYGGDKVLMLNRWCDRSLRSGDMVVYNAYIDDGEENRWHEEQAIARIAELPGDTVFLNNERLLLDSAGQVVPFSRDLYIYNSRYDDRVLEIIRRRDWGVSELAGYEGDGFVRSFTADEAYFLSKAIPEDLDIRLLRDDSLYEAMPVVVPKKGIPVKVNRNNIYLLKDALVRYENCVAEIKDASLYVNGKKAGSIVFGRDYYWLKSENVMDMFDSRSQGYVPSDNISGRLTVIFFSRQKDGDIRWNRMFDIVE